MLQCVLLVTLLCSGLVRDSPVCRVREFACVLQCVLLVTLLCREFVESVCMCMCVSNRRVRDSQSQTCHRASMCMCVYVKNRRVRDECVYVCVCEQQASS